MTTIAPEAATTAATVRPAALVIFGAGGDLPALMQLASYLVRMPVILTNRAESVRIANHVVASLYAYADGVAAAGLDKVDG